MGTHRFQGFPALCYCPEIFEICGAHLAGWLWCIGGQHVSDGADEAVLWKKITYSIFDFSVNNKRPNNLKAKNQYTRKVELLTDKPLSQWRLQNFFWGRRFFKKKIENFIWPFLFRLTSLIWFSELSQITIKTNFLPNFCAPGKLSKTVKKGVFRLFWKNLTKKSRFFGACSLLQN